MQNSLFKPLVVSIACALASGNVFADTWADQVADSSGVLNPGNALHAPDASTASMDQGDTITLNFLDNICFEPVNSVTSAGTVDDVDYHIIGFPDAPVIDWANQVTLAADEDGTELDAVSCDGGDILSWADFGGVIGDRKVKGNQKTQNVSFKGVAYSAGIDGGDGDDTINGQVGWLEVNYRNGVSCNFFPADADNSNQFYLSDVLDPDQRLALMEWSYECSNEDNGSAEIVLLNSALTSFDLGGGSSLDGVPADGTYYLPEATGKGRTKFRGAICINASNDAYDVDGGSNVVYDGGDGAEPICDNVGIEATPENSGDLQWGEIQIGGHDFLPF